MIIGIDATNLGGGGGVTHLKEILASLINDFPLLNNDHKIIVFSSTKVLQKLPDSLQIEKLTFPELNRNLLYRVLFQLFRYDQEIVKRCDILFSITGDYIGHFKPVVSMSQNMLLYERTIWREIKYPKEIIRFWLNYQKQKRSFKNSDGIIFISKYAHAAVSKQINLTGKKIVIIHHGVSDRFRGKLQSQNPISDYSDLKPFRLLYVSTVHVYKHQWNIVNAVGNLHKKGYPVELFLVGGIIFKPAGDRLIKVINRIDPEGSYIKFLDHIQYEEISEYYKNTDGIVFASTCENMPNILIESMSSGRPIACSDKQPMPEFLKENGFYFNSYNVNSIESAIEKLIMNPSIREKMAKNNLSESMKYSWRKTTIETLNFIKNIYKDYYHV